MLHSGFCRQMNTIQTPVFVVLFRSALVPSQPRSSGQWHVSHAGMERTVRQRGPLGPHLQRGVSNMLDPQEPLYAMRRWCELSALPNRDPGPAREHLGTPTSHHLQLYRDGPQRGVSSESAGAHGGDHQHHHQPQRWDTAAAYEWNLWSVNVFIAHVCVCVCVEQFLCWCRVWGRAQPQNPAWRCTGTHRPIRTTGSYSINYATVRR